MTAGFSGGGDGEPAALVLPAGNLAAAAAAAAAFSRSADSGCAPPPDIFGPRGASESKAC